MTLLDPAFMRELEAMRRRFRPTARSASAGARLGRRRGGHAEFAEHRSYANGDDLRRVDWSAFARAGTPVTKTYRAEEDVVVRLVVDASASSSFGAPSKLSVAKRVAAGVAYLALAESERAQVVCVRERVDAMSAPARGRAALPKVLRDLEAISPSGGTDLAHAVDDAVGRLRRSGALVVLSDFFDPGPWDAAISRASAAGHDVALVHVLADEEVAPAWDGDVALVDAETGETVELTFDAGVLAAYEARLASLIRALGVLAARARGSYVQVFGDADVPAAVRRLVGRAIERWAPSSS